MAPLMLMSIQVSNAQLTFFQEFKYLLPKRDKSVYWNKYISENAVTLKGFLKRINI